MSVHLVTVVSQIKMPPAAKLVLLALAESASDNDQRIAYPGSDKMAEWAGLSDRQVRRVLSDLVENGLLDRLRRGQKYRRAEYRVLPFGCCERHKAWSSEDVSGGHHPVRLSRDSQAEHHVRLNGSQADIQNSQADIFGSQADIWASALPLVTPLQQSPDACEPAPLTRRERGKHSAH